MKYLLVLALLGFCLPAFAAEVIIANPSVQEAQLTRNDARLIYTLRRTQWANGQPIRVFVLPDDAPQHAEFVKHSLGLYPRQLRRVWDRRTYSGTGQAPQQVESVDEMLSSVAGTPGAIGYLPERLIEPTVKVLEVRP
jgi:ABC-type phosphate transport system substrate-binding protein